MTATELRAKREKREELRAELRDLDGRLRYADGDTAGLEQRAANLRTGLARLDDELREADREYIGRLAESPRHREHPAEDQTTRRSTNMSITKNNSPGAEQREAAIRACDKAFERNTLDGPSGERLVDVIKRDMTGWDAGYVEAIASPHYESAFRKQLFAAGPSAALTADEQASMEAVGRAMQFRAMATGEGATGGYALPLALDPSILISAGGATNPLRRLASVKTITTSEWAGLTSAGVTAEFVAEGTEAEDNSPTLAQPKIKPEKAQCFVPFSIELGQDWDGLQGELGRLFVDAKEVLEAEKMVSGTGTDEPFGIVTGATETVTTATKGVFAEADVYSLAEALPPRFRPGASWLMSDTIANETYKMAGPGSEVPALMNIDRTSILGKPYAEASEMQGSVTEAKVIALYGDIAAAFKVIDRIGATIEIIPNLLGENGRPTGERGAYMYWRVGSKVVVPNALRALKVKNT